MMYTSASPSKMLHMCMVLGSPTRYLWIPSYIKELEEHY